MLGATSIISGRRGWFQLLSGFIRLGMVLVFVFISQVGAGVEDALSPFPENESVAPNLIGWQRSLGGNSRDDGKILQTTPDGGFILAVDSWSPVSGVKTSPQYGNGDFWLIRLDAAGQVLWQESFGGTGYEFVMDLVQTEDGGFLVGGPSGSPVSGNKSSARYVEGEGTDYWVMKVSAGGEKMWDRSFGGTGSDWLSHLGGTPDGGFLLIGDSRSSASGNRAIAQQGTHDVWVVKIDAGGNRLWEKALGVREYSYVRSVWWDDGGLVLGGFTSSDQYFTDANFWIVRMDFEGEVLWEQTFGGERSDTLGRILSAPDGGFILAGSSRSEGTGDRSGSNSTDSDFWVVKTDADGAMQWEHGFGGSDYDWFQHLLATVDGGYLLTGTSSLGPSDNKEALGFGEADFWVVKIDANGVKEWDKSFGGSGNDYIYAVVERADGGFLLGGGSDSPVSGNKESELFADDTNDGWIVAINSRGEKEWEKALGGIGHDRVTHFLRKGDDEVVAVLSSFSGISGNKTIENFGQNDVWVVSLGLVGTPVIIRPPKSSAVALGGTATLQVTAVGSAPLSFQWRKNGVEMVGETQATLVISDFQISDEGGYTVVVSNLVGSAVSAVAELTARVPLNEALDSPGLTWVTNENEGWFGQKVVSHDAVSAARSGESAPGGESWIETTLTGPGTISFWWRLSARNEAQMVFSINGERQEVVEENLGWWLVTHDLPVGSHTVRWSFVPIGEVVSPESGAWLDRVAFAFGDGGSIEVLDSISPATDHVLPFGKLPEIVPARATVSVRNTDPDNDLVVDRISLRISSETVSFQSAMGEVAASNGGNSPHRRFAPDWDRPHHPSSILVRFKGDTGEAQRMSAHAAMRGKVVRRMARTGLEVVQIPAGADLRQVVEIYNADSSVVYAEPNYILTPFEFQPDPHFSQLWALNNSGFDGGLAGADIGALRAWEMTKGSEEILVAVIDSGVDYTHPDLAANMWVNPSPGFGDLHGASWTSGLGFVTDGNPMDEDGHGTHVAGTIGAVAGNGEGVMGVSPRVRIMALKFMQPSEIGTSGTIADAISAIEYAVDHGAHLSNNSWGGEDYSSALFDAILEAGHANHLFIAAAGNAGNSSDIQPLYPAAHRLANIVSVANSDRRDRPAASSNYGVNTVHLAAPGSGILSTVPGSRYASYSGTSMAAPHVAGVAALLFSVKPGAGYAEVRNAILEGANRLPEWQGLVATGGRLDAHGALLKFNESLEFALSRLPEFPVVLRPGETLEFEVLHQPKSAGLHEGSLFIESQDPEKPMIEVSLSGTFDFTLAEALNTPGWNWETGGDAPWVAQTGIATGEFANAMSGRIGDFESSWLKAEVVGPGRLGFRWKVSSELTHDRLELRVNGEEEMRISGELDWREEWVDLPEGPQVVEWVYTKDPSIARGSDRGWLAFVEFVPRWPTFTAWAVRLGLPADGRRALDRHGPLDLTNLAAYAMGLDPRTATPGDLPRMEGSEQGNRVAFHYRRSSGANGVVLIFEGSDTLNTWRQIMPAADSVLDYVDGVEYRAAQFEVGPGDRLFVRLKFVFLSE